MSEQRSAKKVVMVHFGPVYYPSPPHFGDSFAACRPGAENSTLTTDKRLVTCEKCKQTNGYRYG